MRKELRLRQRLCRFEMLELRQVLSATFGLDSLATPLLKNAQGHNSASPTGLGFTPAQIRQAYGIDNILLPGGVTGDGKGTTIAIVDAFNNPSIINDVKAFSTQFGLQQFNVAGGPTFKVVNQRGASILPTNANVLADNWALETALDVEWAHSVAPQANILLVEATTNSFIDLLTAVNYARSSPGLARFGTTKLNPVVVVSNSYGGNEGMGEEALDFYYTTPSNHSGVAFVVSAGDDGAPAQWPSASPNVLSVGGTQLQLTAANNYSSESIWSNIIGAGGGGMSDFENAPSYQQSLGLAMRGTPDVAYNGDPTTGFPVYSTYAFSSTTKPWEEIGGTSAGAPQWAGLIAIADQGRALLGKSSLVNVQAVMYKLPSSDFRDVTTGSNGNSAGVGYDLASGLGSPIANLLIRDLINYNGTILLPASRTAIAGGSNGVWYFFARSSAAGGDSGGATNVAADIGDSVAESFDDAGGQPVESTAVAYVAAVPTDAAQMNDTADRQLAALALEDGMTSWRHRGSSHHSVGDNSAAVVDQLVLQLS